MAAACCRSSPSLRARQAACWAEGLPGLHCSLVLLILPCLDAALQLRLPDLREGESLMPPARPPASLSAPLLQ